MYTNMPHLSPEPSMEPGPDPGAAPAPFDRENLVVGIAGFFGAVAIAGAGAVFVLGSCFTTHTHGASRSTRLKWEERQRAIQQARAEAGSLPPAEESDVSPEEEPDE